MYFYYIVRITVLLDFEAFILVCPSQTITLVIFIIQLFIIVIFTKLNYYYYYYYLACILLVLVTFILVHIATSKPLYHQTYLVHMSHCRSQSAKKSTQTN